MQSDDDDDLLAGPEGLTLDDTGAVEELENESRKERETFGDQDIDGGEILEGGIYDFAELAKIDAGEAPKPANEDIEVIGSADDDDWDVGMMVLGAHIYTYLPRSVPYLIHRFLHSN